MKALVLQSSPGYNKMVLVDACGYCLPPNKVFFYVLRRQDVINCLLNTAGNMLRILPLL